MFHPLVGERLRCDSQTPLWGGGSVASQTGASLGGSLSRALGRAGHWLQGRGSCPALASGVQVHGPSQCLTGGEAPGREEAWLARARLPAVWGGSPAVGGDPAAVLTVFSSWGPRGMPLPNRKPDRCPHITSGAFIFYKVLRTGDHALFTLDV